MKNILVQYKGGGYDGCFWEWNYFAIDKQGKFHDVASSGHNGITEEADALACIKEQARGTYIYDLNTDADIREFQAACNAGHVIGVIDKVNELIGDGIDITPLYWFCDHCNTKMEGGGHGCDHLGCGGVAIQDNTKICNNCYPDYDC